MSYLFGGIQPYRHDFFSERTYVASRILSTAKDDYMTIFAVHDWIVIGSTTSRLSERKSSKRPTQIWRVPFFFFTEHLVL